jgi:4a-hydroxytetrahydrobiopterin dehydratase
MDQICELAKGKCKPCEGGVPPLTKDEASRYLATLPGWQQHDTAIAKTYRFKNYHETMAFVNATAWISHREDHHPNLAVGYNQCMVTYTTHAIGGLSENDFICAAKIDALFSL